MRVGIWVDFRGDRVSGIRTYVRNLLRALVSLGQDGHYQLFVNRSNAAVFRDLQSESLTRILVGGRLRERLLSAAAVEAERRRQAAAKSCLAKWVEKAAQYGLSLSRDAALLRNCGPQVMHYTTATMPLSHLKVAMPRVVSVYEVHRRFQSPGSKPLSVRHERHAVAVRAATRIITLSGFTRDNLVRHLGAPAERIEIVHGAAGPEFSREYSRDEIHAEKVRRSLPDSFLFYPAFTWSHKNHVRLLEALAILQRSRPVRLVLTGRPRHAAPEIRRAIARLGLSEQVIELGYVPDEEVPLLYRLATALVFPSLGEGFGLPIVEAMASGCPVVCSGVTSLPEVAGDAALFCDPTDSKDIAEKVALLLDSEDMRRRLIDKGLARAAQFSWEKAALQTFKVYESAVREGPASSVGLRQAPPSHRAVPL